MRTLSALSIARVKENPFKYFETNQERNLLNVAFTFEFTVK